MLLKKGRERKTKRYSSPCLRWLLAKLCILSGREDCRLFEQHGFKERRRGSHIVMQKRIPESTITIPVPEYSEIRIGTLQSIIRQSGISRSFFEVG